MDSPENEYFAKNIITAVHEGISLIKSEELSPEQKAAKLKTLALGKPVQEALQATGESLDISGEDGKGNLVSESKDEPGRIEYFSPGDLLVQILYKTKSLRAKPLSNFFDQFPDYHDGFDHKIDIAAFLKENGLLVQDTRHIDFYEVNLNDNPQCVDALSAYLGNSDFSVFSLSGSGAILYSDPDKKVVYKVYRPIPIIDSESLIANERQEKYAKKEVEVLKMLDASGITPHFVKSNVDTEHTLPIIIMERISSFMGVNSMPPQIKQEEAERIYQVFSTEGLLPGDVEFVWDTENEKIRMLDAGGTGILPSKIKGTNQSKNRIRGEIESKLQVSLHQHPAIQ